MAQGGTPGSQVLAVYPATCGNQLEAEKKKQLSTFFFPIPTIILTLTMHSGNMRKVMHAKNSNNTRFKTGYLRKQSNVLFLM